MWLKFTCMLLAVSVQNILVIKTHLEISILTRRTLHSIALTCQEIFARLFSPVFFFLQPHLVRTSYIITITLQSNNLMSFIFIRDFFKLYSSSHVHPLYIAFECLLKYQISYYCVLLYVQNCQKLHVGIVMSKFFKLNFFLMFYGNLMNLRASVIGLVVFLSLTCE